MPPTKLLLPIMLLIAGLSLVACGSDDGGASSAEDEITQVIESSVASTDPADCTQLLTQSFLEQTELEEGEAAVKSCEESAADTADDADSAEATDVEVDGSTATASVAFVGGTFDGQTVNVSLVDEDGWKLDRIESLPDFDPVRFGEAYAETATQGEDALTQDQAQCAGDNMAKTDSADLEAIILSGDPAQFAPLFEGC